MASYNNPQPFVPMVPEFQPDLNSYQQLLSMKEAQYQSGYQKVAGLYGSLYNSPMIREDNKVARSQYFDKIESDIRKLAGYDLSLEQNITSAQKIFKPLSDDPFIMKDIAFTKQVQSELGRAEGLRNSIPKEGEPKFWEGGIRALTYQVDDFAAASREKSLNMQAPRYTPFTNVAEKAMKWAKDMGLSMKTVSKEGGFIITTKNGQPMEAGLRDTFLSVFGSDASVQDMYRTQAYLTRKDAITSTLDQYDSPALAEAAYLDMNLAAMDMDAKEVLAQIQPKLEAISAKKSLAEKAMQSYTYDPELDKDIADLYEQLHMDEQTVGATKGNAEAILQHVNVSGMGDLDLEAKRMRVDGAAANYLMLNDLTHAATAYSQLTMEQDTQADPYALASYNHSNQMAQINAKADLDLMTEYAKLGVNIHEEGALDKYWQRKLLLDQTGAGGGGKGGSPLYPGSPGSNMQPPSTTFGGNGTNTNSYYGSNADPDGDPEMDVVTSGKGQVVENIDVYAENYNKVKESASSVTGYADMLTKSWMSELASVYRNTSDERRELALGEMKKIIGFEKFEQLKAALGTGDKGVIEKIQEWNKAGAEMYDGSDEGNLMSVYGRARSSVAETMKAFNEAASSSGSTAKILRVSGPKQAEMIALQQLTERNLTYWKKFDRFAKKQNLNVVKELGPVDAGFGPVDKRVVNSYLDESGKKVSREQFLTKWVDPKQTPLERMTDAQAKDLTYMRSIYDNLPTELTRFGNKSGNPEILRNRGLVQNGIQHYQGRERQRLEKYKQEALSENFLVDPYYSTRRYSTPEAFAQAIDGYMQHPPQARLSVDDAYGYDPVEDIAPFSGNYKERLTKEYTDAAATYSAIDKQFYAAYNGNQQSVTGRGAVAKAWNNSAMLKSNSGGAHAGARVINVDQANFDPFANPHFKDIHEVMSQSQSLQGNYQFGSVIDLQDGDIEDDELARSVWGKIGALILDPTYGDSDKKGRVRGKFEVAAVTANNPNLVGFTWRPDPVFIAAHKGTAKTEGLFTKKEQEKMMQGVSFTLDKDDASSLKIINELDISNDDAILGISDEQDPVVLSLPDAGSITIFSGPQGYVINKNLNRVDESGKIIPWVEDPIIEPFTSRDLIGRANQLLDQRAKAVRAARLSMKGQDGR